MNTALFKAKLKDWKTNPQQNRWIEGYYLSRKETTYCFTEDYERFPVDTLHFIAEECMTDWGLPNDFRLYEIDPDTLCIFTGFKDIHNNKLYEKDTVKLNEKLYTISWDETDAMYVLIGSNVIIPFCLDNRRCELVGNKFDRIS